MKSAYFKELKRYSKQDIARALHTDINTAVALIRRLKSYGVVKAVGPVSDEIGKLDFTLQDEHPSDVDISISNQLFVFNYVGVITVDNFVFKCYPKYISSNPAPFQELKQVLQVIRKYNSRAHIINMSNGLDEQSPFNMLAIMLFLLNDYIENGLYSNQRTVLEENGEGEINWDTTINESFAILTQNRPVYVHLFTTNTIDDTDNIIHRIHRSVITQCSLLLRETGLSELFDLEEIALTDETIDDIGEDDFLLSQITNEMNIQFVTRKQILLKTLYAFISQRSLLDQGFGLSLYGTSSFHVIWENVCSSVFGSHLHKKLKDLPVPLSPRYRKLQDETLISLIEKPAWTAISSAITIQHRVTDTLIPDLITIYTAENLLTFGIFDAKYYVIKLDATGVSGQPGIGDITKQYLYQHAYKDFIQENNLKSVINAFLCPGDIDHVLILGEASLDMLHSLGLSNIQVWKLPAQLMFDWYLDEKVIDIPTILNSSIT